MATYKRGGVYWFEFVFRGQRVRESTYSRIKEVAGRIERERRRNLELGTAGLQRRREPILFSVAAREFIEINKVHWSHGNLAIQERSLTLLKPHFGTMLLSDITADDVSRYQARRKKPESNQRTGGNLAASTINLEIRTLRALLRKHRLWANIQPEVRMLRERTDVGRALGDDEQSRLVAACRNSNSRSLYPAVVLTFHTGLRNEELRLLRWLHVDLLRGFITTDKSKTSGGEGRVIPLSQTATRCLQEWRSVYPDAAANHFVFPSERYGYTSILGETTVFDVMPTLPMGSWKKSWTTARQKSNVSCRWHDMRHTFVSRLAEGQASDATILALAGHMSRKMLERYSHIRNEAKRRAVAALDNTFVSSRGNQQVN